MIQRYFKLALTAGHSLPLVINANQYDSGEQWIFTLYNDGVKYVPSTGAIVGIKSDQLGIINTGSVDEAGRVVINETKQMTAAVGQNIFELLIDDQTHGTANFLVLVEPRPGDKADLSESDYSLFEKAIQGTSQAAIIAAVQDWMDENLTDPTDPIVDASLSLSGAAADAKVTGDEISELKRAIAQGGVSEDIKYALLLIVNNVSWTGEDPTGQTYITALEHALYPTATITRISCVYTQSGVVFTTDPLNSLKQDLVVTAHYSDGTSAQVLSYTLSGTLTVGTSTITVTYNNKETSFNVTVTVAPLYPLAIGTHPITVDANTVGTMTLSSGAEYTHVKLEFTSNAVIPSGGSNPYYFIRLNEGDCGRASLINNNAQWFNIPASVEGTLELANVVNASSIVFAMNFRKANATASSSFGITDGTHTDGATKTVTLSTAESVGNLFWYTGENKTIPANTIVEFDVRFTLGGERYF